MIQLVSSSAARSAVAAPASVSTKASAAFPTPISPCAIAEPSWVGTVLITCAISKKAAISAAISSDRP